MFWAELNRTEPPSGSFRERVVVGVCVFEVLIMVCSMLTVVLEVFIVNRSFGVAVSCLADYPVFISVGYVFEVPIIQCSFLVAVSLKC